MGRLDMMMHLQRQRRIDMMMDMQRPPPPQSAGGLDMMMHLRRPLPPPPLPRFSRTIPGDHFTDDSGSQSDDSGSQSDDSGSQSDDNHVTDIYKDYDLYLAAKNGDLGDFRRVLDGISNANNLSPADILTRFSPAGNTFLHVAAKHGKEHIVNFIAAEKPSLVLSKNFNGETALHRAAKAGDALMVEALVLIHQHLLILNPLPKNEPDANNLLRAKNERGNTALHEALFNGWVSIAEYLINQDPELSYYENEDGESALYLAAKAGFSDCVSLIFGLSTDRKRIKEQFKGKSPIKAAIQGKHRDVLEAMNMNLSSIQLRDGKGRNPLHYAASLGYLEEVLYLRGQCSHYATQRDKSGSLPIHLASIKGHVDVIRVLLCDCPDPEELLDRDGRSILHLGAEKGRYNVVSFILKNPDLEYLINMKDKYGNTPLHSATEHWQPKIVSALTWDKRVDIKLVNNSRMTALDVADCNVPHNPLYTQRLTWAALNAAGTPRYLSRKTEGKWKSYDMEDYKDRVNTLLLVSTLVATITFAAGFTMPGGHNSSESDRDLGMATMLRHKAFHIFVFCDTIAMYSSIVVAVALIWAQFGDLTLVLKAVTLAEPLLGIALSMMSMAFTSGVSLVISKLRWLSTAVLVTGITFFVILSLLLLPLCSPFASSNRILRYLSYYPFCWVLLAISN